VREEDYDEDGVVAAFLAFLENDLKNHPERIRPLSETKIAAASKLVEGVLINEMDEFPDEIGL